MDNYFGDTGHTIDLLCGQFQKLRLGILTSPESSLIAVQQLRAAQVAASRKVVKAWRMHYGFTSKYWANGNRRELHEITKVMEQVIRPWNWTAMEWPASR